MGGFLSVVISAMAVWMDLREEAVDNSWVLFFDYGRFFTTAFGKGPKGMIIFLTGAKKFHLFFSEFCLYSGCLEREMLRFCVLWVESWVHGQLQNVSFIHCLQVQAFLWQFYFYRRYPPANPLFISVYE